MAAVVWVANSNELLLLGLRNRAENIYLNSCRVTVTLKDATTGAEVEGEPWPRLMKYVTASNGDYVAGLSRLCNFVKGRRYVAHINADASDTDTERYGHWEFPFVAQTRKK